MKYSICDFSQAEITKFNDQNPDNMLDPVDLLIFQWFIDFAAISNIPRKNGNSSKGMWKKIDDGCEYFYVKYDAIIDEFPILAYQSVKSIQRRFDKYVKTGLLCKKVFHEGRKGSFSYFGFTEKLFLLKYDDTKEAQKLNPHKKEENENVTEDKTVQCNENLTQDKNVHCKQKNSVTEDKTVQCNGVTEDKTVQCYIYNSTTNLKNSATTSAFTQNILDSKTSAEAELLNKTNKVFGYEVDFQPDPYPILAYRLKKSEVSPEKWGSYIEWAYKYLKERVKNKNSFDGYFFKSFTQVALIQKYKRSEKEKTAEKQRFDIICPVCSTKHSQFEDCPVCKISQDSLKNEDQIKIYKKIWALPEKEREKYNKKLFLINKKYLALGMSAFLDAGVRQKKQEEITALNAEFKIN